jgi:23S rRNA (guanosine2251-2'-O)-methyltransferase
MGSIIRSAVLCGASGIIIPEKNSASITPVVVHTSAGATEHIKISVINSLSHTLSELSKSSWKVYGTLPEGENLLDIRDFNPPEKFVIVMGSEGEGLAANVKIKCDAMLRIPQSGCLDSFSVSASAAIIFFKAAERSGVFETKGNEDES